MKKLILTLLLLSSSTAFADICEREDHVVRRELAKWQGIHENDIRIHDFKVTINPIFAIAPIIRNLTRPMERCNYTGLRITADIEFEKDGKVCEANLIKSARYDVRLKLKNIICD